MKASHSIVCDKSLGDYIIKNYEVSREAVCTFIFQGVNDSYLISTGSEKYIFRIYRSQWRSKENIFNEVETLTQLEKCSAPIAGILQDKSGVKIQTINCPEGERYGILMHCAANSEIESHCIVSGNIHNYGKAVGQLHNAIRQIKIPKGGTLIDIEHLIWKPLALVESAFPDRKEEFEYLNGFAQRIADELNSVENSRLTKSFIHGDLTGGNASVDEHRVTSYFLISTAVATGGSPMTWQSYYGPLS